MILASAGSGKTWQLTNRYIALMAQQLLTSREVTPERIVAVTFTRKAAGEFFDSILIKLARAASSAEYARTLVGDESIDPEARHDPLRPILSELTSSDYRQLLRIFISRMPRLFLGTLDSFFSAILRSFPAEFGLAGDFEILNDHLGTVERERVYRLVFQRTLPGLKAPPQSIASQQEFLEAFRRATYGKEESSIRAVLDQFVESQHEILLHAAKEELWGNGRVIWPRGCHWLGTQVCLNEAMERLFEALSEEGTTDAQWVFWEEFRNEAIEHVPGTTLPRRVRFFLERLLENWSQIEQEDCTITVNRQKQHLGPQACEILNLIVTHLIGAELDVRLKRTHGVWEVLSLFENHWSHQVRRRGRLTFQDMELILAGHEFGPGMPKPMLSQVPGAEQRLRIDYRLDARYDHWLLDEFQDTNYVQWSVIENLIDEAVQDTSDERTLFQVGDVKQAIYAWRGGDTRLFHDIFKRYNAGEHERIHARPLNVSWRSGHDVIQMVNRVFGNDSALATLAIPQEARQRWQWKEHQVAGVNDALPGHAILLNPISASGEKPTEEDRFALVVGLLEEIQPVARGISCAILVQENRASRTLVDYIRQHSPSRIPVMCESEISVATDNALTLALLSLLRTAAHPGDKLAWEHLRMTPFCAILDAQSMTPSRLSTEVLRQLFDDGFEVTLRTWQHALQQAYTPLDAFSLRRAEDFALAARLFDKGGSRNVDEFLAYAEGYTVREPDTRNAVQVMTIHKSKGLTFDCVLLPDLQGNALTEIRRGIGVKRNRQRQVEWVFDMPPSDIVRADDVLKAFRKEREAEAAYEELCKFYVALTRAKHANYLITEPRAESSSSNNFIRLLELTLGAAQGQRTYHGVAAEVLFESSTPSTDALWFLHRNEKPLHESKPVRETNAAPLVTLPGRARPIRRTPSGSESSTLTVRQLFARTGRAARSHGVLVHALFEQIEWLDPTNDAVLGPLWAAVPTADASLRAQAEEEVHRCLARPSVRSVFRRPTPDAVCWRERRFEILLGHEWLSGSFDRVVLEADSATVFDFKTDKLDAPEDLAERIANYRPQMQTYREVLARMTGLPLPAIQGILVFTHPAVAVTVH